MKPTEHQKGYKSMKETSINKKDTQMTKDRNLYGLKASLLEPA